MPEPGCDTVVLEDDALPHGRTSTSEFDDDDRDVVAEVVSVAGRGEKAVDELAGVQPIAMVDEPVEEAILAPPSRLGIL